MNKTQLAFIDKNGSAYIEALTIGITEDLLIAIMIPLLNGWL